MTDSNMSDIDFSGTKFDSGKIRNPERIDPICEALSEQWKQHPDLRLGQLVAALTAPHDPFGEEDTEIMDKLDVEFDAEYWVDREGTND